MARPLSEEKREAILEAAAELVAQMGTGASTANIAKAAGVAEGTLFTYFGTKDDLLNQLFVEIEKGLAGMLASSPQAGSPRERVRHIWDRLIDWGVANPTQRKALRQLKVSDRVSAKSRRSCDAMFQEAREMVEQSLAGGHGVALARERERLLLVRQQPVEMRQRRRQHVEQLGTAA